MDSTVRIVSQNLVTHSNFFGFRNSHDFTFFEAPTSDTWHLFGWLTMSRVYNGEDKSKVQDVAMCHNLIGRKSKVMDKRIRKSKGVNRRVTCRPPT